MSTFHNLFRTALVTGLMAVPALAQTHLAHARIQPSAATTTGYVIEGTQVSVFSSTLDLKALFQVQDKTGVSYLMKLRDTGCDPARLEVTGAKAIPTTLTMVELLIGTEAKVEVCSASHDYAWVYLTDSASTGFLPLGAAGSWFLGKEPILVGALKLGPGYESAVTFAVPKLAALVGQSFVAQAVLAGPASLSLSNTTARTVR